MSKWAPPYSATTRLCSFVFLRLSAAMAVITFSRASRAAAALIPGFTAPSTRAVTSSIDITTRTVLPGSGSSCSRVAA